MDDTAARPADDKVGAELNAQRFKMLEDIARDLAGEVVFPTCFDAALHLRKELQKPDASIARIAKIVGMEPLIAAKLMNIANSVLYNPGGAPVLNLPAAISRLGVNLVRTTALAVAMGELLRSKEVAVFTELTHALWEHSIKAAVAMHVLARTCTRINPDEAFLAGLVHDLGAFYMIYRAAQYPELRARPESMKHLIVHWHESIGVTLLYALGMPAEIVEATVDHDQPRPAPASVRTLADIVYVGNVLAGTHFEWLYQDYDPEHGQIGLLRELYADVLPEIDDASRDMLALLS